MTMVRRRLFCFRILSTFFLFICLAVPVPGDAFSVEFAPGEKVRITEKSNLRRYEEGRFVGLSYREVRGLLEVSEGRIGQQLAGKFYVFEETKRDASLVAKRIDKAYPARFDLREDGTYLVDEAQAYPVLRSFPAFPVNALEPGDKWEAFGTRVVEPFRDGVFTRVRFYSGYEYIGIETREGRDHHVIAAQYAMRYKAGQDPYGDDRIQRITGKHVVKIYFDLAGTRPSFMRDSMEESYQLADGGNLGFKGFILTWLDDVSLMDRPGLAGELRQSLEIVMSDEEDNSHPAGDGKGKGPHENVGLTSESGDLGGTGVGKEGSGGSAEGSGAKGGEGADSSKESGADGAEGSGADRGKGSGADDGASSSRLGDTGQELKDDLASEGDTAGITIEETNEGVSLTIGRIHFVPDKAEVLPEDGPRLTAVAEALKKVAGRTFLVIGHTADIGQPENQQDLSLQRAKAVVDFLTARGIEARRFLYEGRGGTEPLASNSTDEGRARNRRVEILILED